MNYYINGDAAKAEQIKAAFEKLGYDTTGWKFDVEGGFYYTHEGRIELASGKFLINLIKTHPDYKELELPVEPKFKVGDWLYHNTYGARPILVKGYSKRKGYKVECIRTTYYLQKDVIENEYHFWSMADAKDGDVLVTEDYIFIFKYILHGGVHLYCHYNIDDEEFDSDIPDAIIGNIHDKGAHFQPATKEQHILFFAKIKEAGYQWDADKKELRKIIKPKFKVGDNIKTGSTIETIAEVGHATRSYYCESGRTISFENQDLWHLTPNPHYDIKNFHVGMPVLVRADNACRWDYSVFSRITGNKDWQFAVCNGVSFTQCIPFEGNEHLLGTTDQCDEQYINW